MKPVGGGECQGEPYSMVLGGLGKGVCWGEEGWLFGKSEGLMVEESMYGHSAGSVLDGRERAG